MSQKSLNLSKKLLKTNLHMNLMDQFILMSTLIKKMEDLNMVV